MLKAEAEMRDLRPLFLPTKFNVALAEPRREPGRTLLDEERPTWAFIETDPGLGRELPPVATLNGKPADKAQPTDTLASAMAGVGLVGFGRADRKVAPAPARAGFLEVVAVSTGRTVLAEPLPASMAAPAGKPWEPLELFATIDAAGLAAPLVVTEGSRVEDVDVHFKKALAQTYRIGERLSPGFYRIVVGP
ncbi:MAG: hypothetical protein HZC55_03575 [Verrucomicrobia bacterium]|nr:hypothetical protein [Verrucomicrobiota bacterium]